MGKHHPVHFNYSCTYRCLTELLFNNVSINEVYANSNANGVLFYLFLTFQPDHDPNGLKASTSTPVY